MVKTVTANAKQKSGAPGKATKVETKWPLFEAVNSVLRDAPCCVKKLTVFNLWVKMFLVIIRLNAKPLMRNHFLFLLNRHAFSNFRTTTNILDGEGRYATDLL